ncbi:MAG: tetratricopeptide repeat protein [Kiritimatiellae bacterium]|nr:tetratricopeptide repeat protein [Kiritimatiellia bacterium]
MSSDREEDVNGRLAAHAARQTPGSPAHRRDALAGLALLAVTLAVYAPVIAGGFVWDDHVFLVDNPLIHAPDGLWRFWFTTEPTDYFPVTSSLLWFEWRLFGQSAAGYHLVNVLLHALSAVLVWRVLRKLNAPGAWAAGVLFAVHPVNVATAGWITEHKNTVSLAFFLAAVLVFLDYDADRTAPPRAPAAAPPADPPRALRRDWLALALFVLALLSKTSVVMGPFVLLGCLGWRHGRLTRAQARDVLPFFAASLALGLVTVWFQYNNAIAHETARTDGFLSRLAVAGAAVWFYLGKAVLPHDLSFIYPRWPLPATQAAAFLPVAALTAAAVVLVLLRNKGAKPLLFGLGGYALMLLPVLGFFDMYFMQFALVADHWQYPALPGVIALGTGSFAAVLQRRRAPAAVGWLVLLVVGGALGLLSRERAVILADEETLWRDTLSKNPAAWMPENNLGVLLLKRGRYEEAAAHCSNAIRIKPDYWLAHYNAGNVFLEWNKPERAVEHYARALAIKPDNPAALNNLAYATDKLGREEEAVRLYSAAVRLHPFYATAHSNLGDIMVRRDRIEQAIYHYSQVIRVNPNDAEAHIALAVCLLELAKREEEGGQRDGAAGNPQDPAEH